MPSRTRIAAGCRGLDLAQLVRRTGPLATADACEIVCRVAAALQYTADEGFVHRDIKPSNIMLSSDGQVKLLDLGLARFHSGEDAAEMTGTGQALAPRSTCFRVT